MDELEQRQAELDVAEREREMATVLFNQARERLERAVARTGALRQVVAGLGQLRELDREPVPAQERMPVPEEEPAQAEQAPQTNGSAPRGREAVRRILEESPGVWRLSDVVAEVMRREWIDPDAKQPAAAIRVALQRLVKEGTAEKVGAGRYLIRSKDSGETSPVDSSPEASELDLDEPKGVG